MRVSISLLRCFTVVLCCIALLPRVARAQQGSSDSASRAAAEALFEQGRKLMSEQKYAEACPKLQASHKLDPGVGTLLYLGECYEKADKLASSWAAFQEAATLGTSRGEMARVKIAQVRAAALKPRVPMVVFVVEREVEGLELRRDGALVPHQAWGTPLPADAGELVVMAQAPGHQHWEASITVPRSTAEPLPIRVPALAPLNVAPAQAASPESAPTSEAASSTPAGDDEGSSQRTVGLLVGGVGLVALVTSGVLTIVAAGKNSSSKDNCQPGAPNQCSPAGVADRDDAKNLADVATVAGIAGGVVLAGGAAIYFTAPSGPESSTPQGLLVGLQGSF
jgi:serine/threonine-protein kinase